MRRTLIAAALAGMAVATVTGQTLTEQLQKGIYTEDTLGRVDDAIAIYRRIVSTAPPQNDLALQARRRLASALERRAPAAAPVPRALPLERSLQTAVRAPEPLGTVEAGRYRHTWTGVEFNVPGDWIVDGTYLSSDSGQQVQMRDPSSSVTMSVWMIKEKRAAADVATQLAGAPAEKVNQRQNLGYNAPGLVKGSYEIPAYTIQSLTIGGRQATMAVGNYLSILGERMLSRGRGGDVRIAPAEPQEPVAMNEYMAWIYSEDTRAFFFGRAKASDLPQFQPAFDEVILSAFVP